MKIIVWDGKIYGKPICPGKNGVNLAPYFIRLKCPLFKSSVHIRTHAKRKFALTSSVSML
jgi:hypothetical protein